MARGASVGRESRTHLAGDERRKLEPVIHTPAGSEGKASGYPASIRFGRCRTVAPYTATRGRTFEVDGGSDLAVDVRADDEEGGEDGRFLTS